MTLPVLARWINDAKKLGKHLYVSPGTYHFSDGTAIFEGFHLQCADPTRAIFKAINNANDLFVLAPNWVSESNAPWQDISIENCGFDFNGSTAHFASFISFVGGTLPIQYVTVRGNKFFDNTMDHRLYTSSDPKRQYIAILKAEDVLIEDNALSEGGRIKVGRPGRRLIIRANTLKGISENGITVVDNGSGLSSDILIEHNTITNPINSGIFFGTDGQKAGTATTQLYDVTIRANAITGNFRTNCITGVLPNHVARIYIGENTCHKTGPTPTGVYVAGIGLNRNNTSTLRAEDITVQDNTILSDVYNAYNNLAGIFVTDHFENLALWIIVSTIRSRPSTCAVTCARCRWQTTSWMAGGSGLGRTCRWTSPATRQGALREVQPVISSALTRITEQRGNLSSRCALW